MKSIFGMWDTMNNYALLLAIQDNHKPAGTLSPYYKKIRYRNPNTNTHAMKLLKIRLLYPCVKVYIMTLNGL